MPGEKSHLRMLANAASHGRLERRARHDDPEQPGSGPQLPAAEVVPEASRRDVTDRQGGLRDQLVQHTGEMRVEASRMAAREETVRVRPLRDPF